MDYLEKNYNYWQTGHNDENVERFVFRVYGRIFKAQFGIDGSHQERLLDLGCGTGAALDFFHRKGFRVYGVDISKINIEKCINGVEEEADHFKVIPSKPDIDDNFFDCQFDAVTAIQCLYYLSDSELEIRLRTLHNQMKKGAIIYATMMGTRCDLFYKNSTASKDGLRKVKFTTDRYNVDDYFVNFTESENDLLKKFHMFKKVHIGYYDSVYREDEGSDFHYTFIGQK